MSENLLTDVYADRNHVALAFAFMADAQGWNVGYLIDGFGDHDWPVLVVDTPCGQVSWHLPKEMMPPLMRRYNGVWDGHTTAEKNDRLANLIRSTLR